MNKETKEQHHDAGDNIIEALKASSKIVLRPKFVMSYWLVGPVVNTLAVMYVE